MAQTAMVWGAAGGIGRALVQQLAEQGWTTIAVARHAADLTALTPHVIEADVGQPAQVEAAVLAAAMETESIDLWIYTVGDIAAATVADMTSAQWDRILAANLTGAFLATHHSRPLLAENAHLIFVGAISERLRLPGLSAYAAAKAGLEAFGETLRKEERQRRVTVVRPAAVATPLWDKVPMRMPAHAVAPAAIATRILEIVREGTQGTVDITT